MNKLVSVMALMALMGSSAFAAPVGCTPAKGNWVNAADYTCPIVSYDNNKVKKHKCDHKPKSI